MKKLVDHLKKLLFRDGVTPLPTSLVIIMFLNMIFYSMVSTVLFSFLPKMVKHFGASELNTGYYAGIIASAIFVGRFFGSIFWGYMADTISKRKCFLLTGFVLIMTSLAFGFSRDFTWAVVTRLLQGCSMGQLIIFKVILAEVCDDTNMPLGMTILMTAFSMGSVIGPSIGGFLVFPAEQYPTVFSSNGVFGRFSILLPNFVITAGIAIGVVLAIIYLPKDKRKGTENEPLLQHKDTALDGNVTRSNKTKESCLSDSKDSSSVKKFTFDMTLLDRINKSKFIRVLQIKECLYSCVLYGLFSVLDVGFSEMFPVFAATSYEYKGMQFTPSQLALLLMIVSAMTIAFQIPFLPKLTRRYGSKKVLIAASLFLIILCPMIPAVSAVRDDERALWGLLIIIYLLIRLCSFSGYLSINIFLNNSVEADLLGTVNGAGMAIASLGRLIAPVLSGSLYSWSLTNIVGVDGNRNPFGFPFNHFFVFYTFSLWGLLIACLAAILPDKMDVKNG